MARFIARKFINILLSLFVLATATFWLMKIVPGNPFLSEKMPVRIRESLMAYYGLNKPIWEQYLVYLNNLIHFNLGTSMKSQYQSVTGIISDSFVYSLQLGIVAIVVSVVVGVGLGMAAAMYHRRLIDKAAIILAVLGISVPNFVIASMLQYFLGVRIPLFAVQGLDGPLDFVLPVISLSALPIAFIARLTRSSMLEVLTADYIRTAKAKGMPGYAIIVRHGLRNGILPVVTYIGPMTANIITGSVVVEEIFGIPGLGKFFTDSVLNRDYTLIMGITLFYAIILMLARFLTDVAYAFIDPRIKLQAREGG
ncbi:ABC transporter permease [Paenibacillus sp. sptzw28]|uniref:ABC transporter permease n=1 Tax=Paenibacillus sp. sptzw28 TaxID=715179 RepID=UPI001C6E7BFD|nr:ABC transporter permease [Paenibacillus sp. sptzw28]QYR21499.1 ABC transporter permease [Paenibacillus sp. sptzw28]